MSMVHCMAPTSRVISFHLECYSFLFYWYLMNRAYWQLLRELFLMSVRIDIRSFWVGFRDQHFCDRRALDVHTHRLTNSSISSLDMQCELFWLCRMKLLDAYTRIIPKFRDLLRLVWIIYNACLDRCSVQGIIRLVWGWARLTMEISQVYRSWWFFMCHTHGVVRSNQLVCACWWLNLHMRLLVWHFGLRDAAAYLIIKALILVHSVLL